MNHPLIPELHGAAVLLNAIAALGIAAAVVGGLQKMEGSRAIAVPKRAVFAWLPGRSFGVVLGSAEVVLGLILLYSFPSTLSSIASGTLLGAYLLWSYASRRTPPEACGCTPTGLPVNMAVYRAAVFSALAAACWLGSRPGQDGLANERVLQAATILFVTVLAAFWCRSEIRAADTIGEIREASGLKRRGATLFASAECEGCVLAINAMAAGPELADSVVLLTGQRRPARCFNGLMIAVVEKELLEKIPITALPALALPRRFGGIRWLFGAEPIIARMNHGKRNQTTCPNE